MLRLPPRSTRTDTLVPDTTLFRSTTGGGDSRRNLAAACHIRLILPAPHVILRGDTCLLYGKRPEQFLHVGRNAAFEGQIRLRDRMVEPQFCRMMRLRSEVHTSELQSLMRISYAVFCLKKKN